MSIKMHELILPPSDKAKRQPRGNSKRLIIVGKASNKTGVQFAKKSYYATASTQSTHDTTD